MLVEAPRLLVVLPAASPPALKPLAHHAAAGVADRGTGLSPAALKPLAHHAAGVADRRTGLDLAALQMVAQGIQAKGPKV